MVKMPSLWQLNYNSAIIIRATSQNSYPIIDIQILIISEESLLVEIKNPNR